ncbi:MAG: hypothetical protein HDS75_04920 [Bacteroidales bacterium]|nr:hypothetical protein [Bacteroidales bacterium]MDE6802941.1 hypothetical protein [Muribaculaceae bacterium]MDE6832449.1 hypothetical protein [Muribaculaceae bacterium]
MRRLGFIALLSIACATGLLSTGCTENARLLQALGNANINLVGQDNGMGGHCDGLTLSADTVVMTYNFWPEQAGEDLLADPETPEVSRPQARRGLKALMKEHADVADAMLKAKAGFIYRRKFVDGKIDVYFSPEQVETAFRQIQ